MRDAENSANKAKRSVVLIFAIGLCSCFNTSTADGCEDRPLAEVDARWKAHSQSYPALDRGFVPPGDSLLSGVDSPFPGVDRRSVRANWIARVWWMPALGPIRSMMELYRRDGEVIGGRYFEWRYVEESDRRPPDDFFELSTCKTVLETDCITACELRPPGLERMVNVAKELDRLTADEPFGRPVLGIHANSVYVEIFSKGRSQTIHYLVHDDAANNGESLDRILRLATSAAGTRNEK